MNLMASNGMPVGAALHRHGGRIAAGYGMLPVSPEADTYSVAPGGTITSLPIWPLNVTLSARFEGATTIVNSAGLAVSGGADYVTAAGDEVLFVPLGSAGWQAVVLPPGLFVRVDAVTALSAGQKQQGRENIDAHDASKLSTGQLLAARLPDGAIVDSAVGTYATSADLTTQMPYDDTIPQSGEGTQIISLAFTPKSAANKLRCRFRGMASGSALSNLSAALFLNSDAGAIAAAGIACPGANYVMPLSFEHEFVPGATSAQTLKVRVGPGSAVTMRMNGTGAARLFGGVGITTLVVEEIKA